MQQYSTKRILLTALIIFLILWGVFILSFSFLSYIETYVDYCQTNRNDYFFVIHSLDLFILIIILLIYNFKSLKSKVIKLIKPIRIYILYAIYLKIIITSYFIIKYPLLVQISPQWGGGPPTQTPFINPFIIANVIYSTLGIVLTYKLKLSKVITYIFVLLVIILFCMECFEIFTTHFVKCYG